MEPYDKGLVVIMLVTNFLDLHNRKPTVGDPVQQALLFVQRVTLKDEHDLSRVIVRLLTAFDHPISP
jgi:hypothetical protein